MERFPSTDEHVNSRHCLRSPPQSWRSGSSTRLSTTPRSSKELRPLRRRRGCLLYTSDAADEEDSVDLGGRRILKKKKKKTHHENATDRVQQQRQERRGRTRV